MQRGDDSHACGMKNLGSRETSSTREGREHSVTEMVGVETGGRRAVRRKADVDGWKWSWKRPWPWEWSG